MKLNPPSPALLTDMSAFLDFDGTLVDLGPNRDDIVVPEDLPQLLTRVHAKLGGRLAILSGRAAFDVRSRLGMPSIAIAGNSRGLGTSHEGRETPQRSFGLRMAARELRRLQRELIGVTIEESAAALAIHYRRAPESEQICRRAAERLATATGMVIHYGRQVIQLKSRSTDKGRAVRLFMLQHPFKGSAPVVVADDVTYEHSFVVAREMGGCGVLVGPPRSTAATYGLDDVGEVHRWLRAAVGDDECCGLANAEVA